MKFTREQKSYIYYKKIKDTKLLATAGSGKTRCIIFRIDHLITTKKFNENEIIILTFSRFTRDDFMNRINTYNIKTINESTVKTIDSFAKIIIDKDNEIDVSLLSYKFMKYLEKSTIEELKGIKELTDIKIIFVDEAQDLNNTQYKIFIYLKEKLNININLIGDPNQNIYQFRNSSDKYLTEFKAKTFYLTQNFRSFQPIIDFCEFLRPMNNSTITGNLGEFDSKPTIIFHQNDTELEERLITVLDAAKENEIDFSDIAILSPTRGKMRGYGKSHGLCLISNILYNNGFKFKQFYEESMDEMSTGIKYAPEKGYLNVLTYMGSKGLEWKFVILIDAEICLINKRQFDNTKHSYDQYLLYVACSRAICNMIIFSKYRFNNYGNIDFQLNPWFSLIPKNCYQMDDRFEKIFKFPIIKPLDMGNNEKKITKIIDKLDEESLDELFMICNKNKKNNKKIIQIFDTEFTSEIDNNIFLSKYIQNLFYLYYNIKNNIPRRKYIDIYNIINSEHIVTDVAIIVNEWFYSNRHHLTWESFDNDKEQNLLDKIIVETVQNKFDRKRKLAEHTVVNDNYYKSFILSMRNNIKKNYDKYMESTNTKKLKKYLFNLIVLVYSLETQHYFHVKNKGQKFKDIINKSKNIFSQIKKFVSNNEIIFSETNIPVIGWNGLIGEIDMVEKKKDKIMVWEIKSVNDITLKHILEVLIYNIIYHKLDEFTISDNIKIKINFINFLKGNITKIKIQLTKNDIQKIKSTIIKFSGNKKQETTLILN
jgi:hypothetical protein